MRMCKIWSFLSFDEILLLLVYSILYDLNLNSLFGFVIG